MSFENKIAVITGGNSGIGRSIAEAFIKEDAKVIIIGRNKQTLDQTVDEFGKNCTAIQADLSDVKQIKTCFKTIQEQFSPIDHLIINAGVVDHRPIQDMDEATFDSIFDTNTKGPYFIVQQAAPLMSQPSSIVAISSISALLSITDHAVYSSSKAAVTKMMACLSAELLESKKIRINCISPGYVNTPIFEKRLAEDPTFKEKAARVVPCKRMGEPKEIAAATLFLCSDQAQYIAGANLVIDGGFTSHFPLKELQQFYDSR